MNKTNTLVFLAVLISNILTAQVSQKVYNEACACIGKIDLGLLKKQQLDQTEACVFLAAGKSDVRVKLEDATKSGIPVLRPNQKETDIASLLIRHCPAVKLIISTSLETNTISKTVKKSALKSYEKGLAEYRNGNYKETVVHLQKALKKDNKCTQAWDLLGLTYNHLQDYKEAIAAYNNSININPFGIIPLRKRPIAYAVLGDNHKGIKCYNDLIDVLPKEPEAYYRVGRLYHKIKDYDKALDNTMKSFVLLKERNSPFVKDALVAITLLRNDLTKNNQLDIWDVYAKKYKLSVVN
jgi:tetratricopeptide (TPR) repeat protein